MTNDTRKELKDRVDHHYAENEGIKIHYVSAGAGPLVVMVHGFPDYWYTWRYQMDSLADHFRVVAVDLRGYNRSDKPKGLEAYAMKHLVEDISAVVKDCGEKKATIVGHDWGGFIAWSVALRKPDITDKLIILNLPHPKGWQREIANNPEQHRNSSYARKFCVGSHQDPDILFGRPMTAENLAFWVRDPEVKQQYIQAFEKSDFEAMLNYYKRNFPASEEAKQKLAASTAIPNLQIPVLMFHGLKDKALHSDGLNNTWDWLEQDLTLVTVPDADHFVQQDAAELVSRTMKDWLLART